MYRIIGAASCWGAQLRECEQGPEALRLFGLLEKLQSRGISIRSFDLIHPAISASSQNIPLSESLPLIAQFNRALALKVEKTLAAKEFPVVIGGDHSIAVGTWNGAYRWLKKQGKIPFGLIWIDAHMDAHVPETTPSGAWHGMPIAGLLGRGAPEMARLLDPDPVLRPECLCLIGVRSFEAGEASLLKNLNVKVISMKEVAKKGMAESLREAIDHIGRFAPRFGVSIDLDAIDPIDAPGVGSPEEGGIQKGDFLSALAVLRDNPDWVGLELVEYNPAKDIEGKTAALCVEILDEVLQHESVD